MFIRTHVKKSKKKGYFCATFNFRKKKHSHFLMNHSLLFRVELTLSKITNYQFRGKYLDPIISNSNNSPFFNFIKDERGFIVWKSLNNNVTEIYGSLLNNEFSLEIFKDIKEGFAVIFFDKIKQKLIIGKDKLGLSSLILSEDPFIISSHDLKGEEQPPGFTIFTNDSKEIIQYPKYVRNVYNDLTVDDAIDLLTNALTDSVLPNASIMFSGGVDSSLLAISFGIVGVKDVALINFCANESAPDRKSAREAYEELKVAFPNTNWTLKEFTGSLTEMIKELPTIKELLEPVEITEMNLNIAMTLYSALKNSETTIVYSGLGADELCCGYMRMKTENSADNEINEHMNRLWIRNGGRDDRVAMHLGKSIVFPFLSQKFIEIALKLPLEMLIKPDLPRGKGEKWILRQIADKYGIRSAANRPKQAMQFGSKVAKAKWRGDETIPES